MPEFSRTTPCAECPFKRRSLQGWLGNSTPLEFIRTTMAEHEMPCHMQVDYEQEDWREQQEEVSLCAGSLILFRNFYKRPRDGKLAEAVERVRRNTQLVFTTPWQFLKHHYRGKVPEDQFGHFDQVMGITFKGEMK